jgi:3-deoxy-D-manno-octulosonic-acid transferase
MITRYDALYYALSPIVVPYIAWRWARKRKYSQSGPAMFGRGLNSNGAVPHFQSGSVWIHAVSVGEVAAARALEPGLRDLFPQLPIVLSTTTETGQEAARKQVPKADVHTYFPADLSWNVRKFMNAFRPKIIVLMETEIWPNFLTIARASGARIFLANGKLSDRSFPRYRAMKPLLAPVLQNISGFCVQTGEDARRFAEVGVAPERIRVTGNCKFDLAIEPLSAEERARMRNDLGLDASQPVIVAGSTHRGEEEIVFKAFDEVLRTAPSAALVLAPRHPERFVEVADLARTCGYRVARASEGPPAEPSQVVILDKMGVLARTYGIGDVAIVAGSFCEIGGHNLLEAAAHGVPVIYGPNMRSQRELAESFRRASAGTQTSPGELGNVLVRFLHDADLRGREGEKAFQVLLANRGSAHRTVSAIHEFLNTSSI